MINNLTVINIENREGQLVVTSRQIAENFEKEHKNVLQDIRKVAAEISATKINEYFIEDTFDNRGKLYPQYLLTKKGFNLYMFNIQGYIEYKTAYIERFEEMENQLKNLEVKEDSYMIADPIERAKRWIEEEIRLLFEAKVKEQQSTVEYFDRYMLEEGSFTTTELAKRVGQVMGGRMSTQTLNKLLFVAGIVDEKDKSYEITPKYSEKGWHCYGKKSLKQLRWTPRAMKEIPEFMVKQYRVIK